MTDEGAFERVAMAVLRIAEPLYATLSHPGVNADGKTRKAPLDGIGFVRGADPPHLVAAHHTTTAADGLENKWLHDPATVKPRKPGRKPTAPPGDLVKTADIVAEERVRTPALRATLILTTNEEPDEALVRAAKAAGAAHRIEVDVWSRSRLAHVLDTDPTGQWIRRTLLGIEQEMLSIELLGQLSKASLDVFKPHDHPRAWVPRQLDGVLRFTRRPINFLVAESGLGKTVACYRALAKHIEGGGYGLVLSHDMIVQASTLDQAVTEALPWLHPALAPGQTPLAFCSPDRPLMVVVEDINRSGQPQRLAEKIAGWGLAFTEAQHQVAKPWRLFCPIWPSALVLMGDQTRKLLEPMLIVPEPMNSAEGTQAVIARAGLTGRTLSEVTAGAISTALGHDPLLIALHDINRTPDPHLVLGQFIEAALQRAQATSDAVSAEFRIALLHLAGQMLQRRRLEPFWSEIASWPLTPERLRLIRSLTQREELLRLRGPSTDLRLLFRHDRVRDWLLMEAGATMHAENDLSDEIVGEPFFAEVLGAVIVRRGAPATLLERARILNPLALFHALRVCAQSAGPERARIAETIEDWIGAPSNWGPAYRYTRWEALAALQSTDGPEVPGLVTKFPDRTAYGQMARLRNGDLTGGIEFCQTSEPGVQDPFRDRHLEHAKMRFGGRLIQELDQLLRRQDMDGAYRTGLLRFAGHMGEPTLGPAIDACWSADKTRDERLVEYLWAFACCCGPSTAAQYLDPVCAAWAALPVPTDRERMPSPRDDLAAHNVLWAFERALPLGALYYFIARARQPDLHWQLTFMLHVIDEPRVVSFIAAELGAMRTRAAASGGFSPFSHWVRDHWRRAQEEGRPMSRVSRDLLLRIWEDQTVDVQQRLAAFDIWATTQDAGDIEVLQNATADAELADRVLQQRLDRGDSTAIPALIEKLRDRERGHWWWFYAPHVWSPELTQALDEVLTWRRDHVAQRWGTAIEEDWRTQEMIMRLPVAEAERLLLKHWHHLKFSARS